METRTYRGEGGQEKPGQAADFSEAAPGSGRTPGLGQYAVLAVLTSSLMLVSPCLGANWLDDIKGGINKVKTGVSNLAQNDTGLVEVTLISDKDNTRFRIKQEGDTDFREVGTGKIIKVKLPADKTVTVTAEPPDYVEKSYTLPNPNKQIEFFFLMEDRELKIQSDQENARYRLRRTGDTRWLDIRARGKAVKYPVPHEGSFEIEASAPGCCPTIMPVIDPTGEIDFNLPPCGRMELVSDQNYTRFLIRNIGQGDTNWEYLGVGSNLTDVKVPISGAFEISAEPYGYRHKIQTLQAPTDRLVFSFSEEDQENALPIQHQQTNALRRSLPPRPPEMAGQLAPDKVSAIVSQESWRAVLIGISDYRAAPGGIPNLKTPRNDVEELQKTLEKSYGFKAIALLLDQQATFDNIRRSFFDLDNACGPDDNILIYYAGHGTLASNEAGRWVCADGRELANSEIEDFIRRFKARRVLLASDSCFSGAFLTRDIGVVGSYPPKAEIEKTTVATSEKIVAVKEPVRQILTSGQLEPVPDGGTGYCQDHSPFACQLLTDLQEVQAGAVLSTTDIYKSIADSYHRSQGLKDTLPGLRSLDGDGGGEFYLVRFK